MPEIGWVIEAAGPRYWTGRSVGSESFDSDHMKACRFARSNDAQVVLYYCFKDEFSRLLVVREHVWLDREASDASKDGGAA